MYDKISENYNLQERLDVMNEKLSSAFDIFSIENTMSPSSSSEFDTLNVEKKKCEQMITELQEKLCEERKEYLELLRYLLFSNVFPGKPLKLLLNYYK